MHAHAHARERTGLGVDREEDDGKLCDPRLRDLVRIPGAAGDATERDVLKNPGPTWRAERVLAEDVGRAYAVASTAPTTRWFLYPSRAPIKKE
jgi:hypothetical protein